jgi:hypothetical protein
MYHKQNQEYGYRCVENMLALCPEKVCKMACKGEGEPSKQTFTHTPEKLTTKNHRPKCYDLFMKSETKLQG